MKVTLKTDSGIIKQAPLGFSWTTLFFGFWVALLRGDIKWAIIQFVVGGIVGTILSAIIAIPVIGFFIWGFLCMLILSVFGFIYNKIFVKRLLEKGYKPTDLNSKSALVSRRIITADAPLAAGVSEQA